MLVAELFKVILEAGFEGPGQRYDPVFAALAVVNGDGALSRDVTAFLTEARALLPAGGT